MYGVWERDENDKVPRSEASSEAAKRRGRGHARPTASIGSGHHHHFTPENKSFSQNSKGMDPPGDTVETINKRAPLAFENSRLDSFFFQHFFLFRVREKRYTCCNIMSSSFIIVHLSVKKGIGATSELKPRDRRKVLPPFPKLVDAGS